jgi:Fe-Mn family superoxide dismutase
LLGIVIINWFYEKGRIFNCGALAGAGILFPNADAFSKNIVSNDLDRLVDVNGNYIQQVLPYSEGFLEPYMDSETLHLHYTFHHGGAVKGANKDMQMIKKALDDNSLETVDFWTKKLSYHFSSHVLHSIFWTNLTNKKTEPKGDLLRRIEKTLGASSG